MRTKTGLRLSVIAASTLVLVGCGAQGQNPSLFNGANVGTVLGGGGGAWLCTSLAKGHPITMVLAGIGCGAVGGIAGRLAGGAIDGATSRYQVAANQLPAPGQVVRFDDAANGMVGTQQFGQTYGMSNGSARVNCRDGRIRVAPRDARGLPTGAPTTANVTLCETRPGVYELVQPPSQQTPFDPHGNAGSNYRNSGVSTLPPAYYGMPGVAQQQRSGWGS